MNAAKAVRLAAVLSVLAGYVFVFRAGEGRIGARSAENAQLVERIAAAERTLASRYLLERERTNVRATLRTVQLEGERGVMVARFVRDAARVANAHHTTIATITANGAQLPAAPAAAPQPPSVPSGNGQSAIAPDPFDLTPLQVTVEGRYADVLAVVRALSRTRVLGSVDVASLARKNADAPEATVTAALHVVLHRLAPLLAPPSADVRARPL